MSSDHPHTNSPKDAVAELVASDTSLPVNTIGELPQYYRTPDQTRSN
jgi:hypothetical protein